MAEQYLTHLAATRESTRGDVKSNPAHLMDRLDGSPRSLCSQSPTISHSSRIISFETLVWLLSQMMSPAIPLALAKCFTRNSSSQISNE